jgi:hypothetical protein
MSRVYSKERRVASMLQLPLSAVVLATMLVSSSGAGADPLIIVGVLVAYITTIALDRSLASGLPETPAGQAAAEPS